MVTADAPAPTPPHPFRVGGRARALWCVSRGLRLLAYAAVVALLALAVRSAEDDAPTAALLGALAAGAVVLALVSVERRVRWHAETHVPGAFRTYARTADLPAQRTVRQALPDLVMTVVDAAVLTVGGALVVATAAPEVTQTAETFVGAAGGAALVLLGWNVAVDVVARAADRRVGVAPLAFFAVRAVPAVTWVVVGAGQWAALAAAFVGAVLLIVGAGRLVSAAARWVTGRTASAQRS